MINVSNKTYHSLSHQSWWRKSGAGFTLLELLITIAISGILTAMMFTNFSKEKDRNNLKAAVRQVQTDLQAMQTNAQAGLAQGASVPNGYGIYIAGAGSTYTLFSDMNANNQYTAGEEIRSRTLPGATDVAIKPSSSLLSILFTKPNGKAVITPSAPGIPATLYLRSDRLKICYAITVTSNVGTVSSRQLSAFAAPCI